MKIYIILYNDIDEDFYIDAVKANNIKEAVKIKFPNYRTIVNRIYTEKFDAAWEVQVDRYSTDLAMSEYTFGLKEFYD